MSLARTIGHGQPTKGFYHGATYHTQQGEKLPLAFGLLPSDGPVLGNAVQPSQGTARAAVPSPGQSQGSSSSFRTAGSICREYSSKAAAQAMSGCIYFTDSGPVSFQGVQAVALSVFE